MFAREITSGHGDPFHTIPRETFEAAVADLASHIPGLDGPAIQVELARLAALLNDGHTEVPPAPGGDWPHRSTRRGDREVTHRALVIR